MCRHTQLDTRYQLYIWDMSKQLVVSHINTDKGDPFVTQVCVAGCCRVLYRVAVFYNVLHYVAVCCCML